MLPTGHGKSCKIFQASYNGIVSKACCLHDESKNEKQLMEGKYSILLYSTTETRDLIGQSEVRPKPYGPPKSRMDLKFSNHGGYTIKLLLTNCSFHTENIRTLAFCTDLISFGPYVKTSVRIFCRMDLTIG